MNPTTSSAALSQLESTENSAQDPNAILQQQQQQLGVNNAQQTVQGLQGAINSTTKLLQQVAPSVMGRTQGSLVTSAQANKQIENEQAPLNTTLSNDTNQYNQANTNLNNLQNQAQTAASGIYQGQQDKLSYLQNLYNSLYGQEKDAADLAEQQREANLSASSSANSGLDIGSILSALGSGSSSNPVATLFNGYNPSTDKFYTENVVIPTLEKQYGYSAADASKAAYDYRKQEFGE